MRLDRDDERELELLEVEDDLARDLARERMGRRERVADMCSVPLTLLESLSDEDVDRLLDRAPVPLVILERAA